MPNRLLKESICTSENIDQLSAFNENFFYRLIVNCDDYGRIDARPKILASKLYPLKDIRSGQIEGALRALTSAELVTLYVVGGKPFLQMNTWDRHQTVRAKKSKYPGPEEADSVIADVCNLQASASKCKQMNANAPVIQSNPNPIQSESESYSHSKKSAREAMHGEIVSDFEEFWQAYPRKTGKGAARKAFEKVKVPLEQLIAAVEAQKQSKQWNIEGGRFIPMAATWLNQERWDDTVTESDASYGDSTADRLLRMAMRGEFDE
jgi:hypothetical protein